jgi:F-type H+-transporting ATPase subunit delta
MYISKQSKEEAKNLIKICLKTGSLDENVASEITKYITTNKSNRNLQTLTYFKQLIRLEVNKETAKLEHATDLSDAVVMDITTKLEKIYNRKMRLEKHKKTELIGGFKITVGSDVYDYTTTAKLEQLKNVLRS